MGTTGFSATFSIHLSTVVGAVLAGFGIWTKPKDHASRQANRHGQVQVCNEASRNAVAVPSLPDTIETQRPLQPLRVIRFIDADLPAANAGRMVISGRMSEVCAELDRLAA